MNERPPVREPSLLDALIPLVTLVALIGGAILLFGPEAIYGPIPAALVICSMVAMLVIVRNGHSWDDAFAAANRALSSTTTAIFILLAVGALIGTWCLSGTIPTLVFYGISVLSADWYYAASALICGIIALCIGSAWTTAGTIGVGLVGIATMVGVSTSITAGAVISGAYFGDKLSPLSEATIMTAQMLELNVYDHIRHEAWTAVPAFVIAFLLFFLLGLRTSPVPDAETAVDLRNLDQFFNITIWNLLPLAGLVVLSIRKVPASVSLTGAALLAAVMAPFTQASIVHTFANAPGANLVEAGIRAAFRASATGFTISSGYQDVDQLLNRGGMYSMMLTLWLIMGAVTFGTLLDEFGLLRPLIDPLVRYARGTGTLFLAVFASALGLNIITGDPYVALMLPARAFRSEFVKRGIHRSALSRLCADSGPVTSPLVPWNSSGAFMSGVLGVSTWAYLPFCFFNIAAPLLSVLFGFTGFRIERLPPPEMLVEDPAG